MTTEVTVRGARDPRAGDLIGSPRRAMAKKVGPDDSRRCATISNGYMRKADAAQYLGVSVRQLPEMMKRNVVPFAKVSHRICLFKSEDLDRAISRFRVEVHGE